MSQMTEHLAALAWSEIAVTGSVVGFQNKGTSDVLVYIGPLPPTAAGPARADGVLVQPYEKVDFSLQPGDRFFVKSASDQKIPFVQWQEV